MDSALLTALRREIATIEGRPAGLVDDGIGAFSEDEEETGRLGERAKGKRLPLGMPALDARLGGGLRSRRSMNSGRGRRGDSGALTGFAAALLARLAAAGRPAGALDRRGYRRAPRPGIPYGRGLDRFGLDPARLIVVRAAPAGRCAVGASRRGCAAAALPPCSPRSRGHAEGARPHRQSPPGAARARRRRHGPSPSPGERGRARRRDHPLAGRAAPGRRDRTALPTGSAGRPGRP